MRGVGLGGGGAAKPCMGVSLDYIRRDKMSMRLIKLTSPSSVSSSIQIDYFVGNWRRRF